MSRDICPDSPWALTATLSSLLATHLYPTNSFFQLKTGLLLSLASQVGIGFKPLSLYGTSFPKDNNYQRIIVGIIPKRDC